MNFAREKEAGDRLYVPAAQKAMRAKDRANVGCSLAVIF